MSLNPSLKPIVHLLACSSLIDITVKFEVVNYKGGQTAWTTVGKFEVDKVRMGVP